MLILLCSFFVLFRFVLHVCVCALFMLIIINLSAVDISVVQSFPVLPTHSNKRISSFSLYLLSRRPTELAQNEAFVLSLAIFRQLILHLFLLYFFSAPLRVIFFSFAYFRTNFIVSCKTLVSCCFENKYQLEKQMNILLLDCTLRK